MWGGGHYCQGSGGWATHCTRLMGDVGLNVGEGRDTMWQMWAVGVCGGGGQMSGKIQMCGVCNKINGVRQHSLFQSGAKSSRIKDQVIITITGNKQRTNNNV